MEIALKEKFGCVVYVIVEGVTLFGCSHLLSNNTIKHERNHRWMKQRRLHAANSERITRRIL